MGLWDDELILIFLAESRDHLADIETDLLAMEVTGADIDEELVNKVFRAAHSIKGGAGFFTLTNIQELAHKTENALELVRSREMSPTPEVVNILLTAFDKLRELINNPDASNDADISEYVVSLSGLTTSHLEQNEKASLNHIIELPLPSGIQTISVSEFDLERARKGGNRVYIIEYDMIHDIQKNDKNPLDVIRSLQRGGILLGCILDLESVGTLDDEMPLRMPFFVLYSVAATPSELSVRTGVSEDRILEHLTTNECDIAAGEPIQEAISSVANDVMEYNESPIFLDGSAEAATNERAIPIVEAPVQPEVRQSAKEPAAASSNYAESSLRVSVSLLESLMNLAGELVLSRNQLVEAVSRDDSRLIRASGQRISLVTSELQEAIMLTRMQPVGNVLNKFPRVIRDMSRELNKDIQLQVSGKEVEMDKTIIEGLSDPLTHLIRNAADHGIETPEIRTQKGKKPSGTVNIGVYHEAGQVVIEISDDGKGIDSESVVQAALTKGVVHADQVKTMSEAEKMALILQPGLSTAEKVTDISGRGVGMDVVKTNLDKLGGKIEIESEIGKGTTFRIKLPLTLAIIPSLLISIGDERFAIPQVNVREMVHINAQQLQSRIEIVGDAQVLMLRGELIPIVSLAGVLGLEADNSCSLVERGEDLKLVVLSSGAVNYGLLVEELHDTVEIVMKPVGRHLKGLCEYAGATIMGDGRVALILDVAGISEKAGLSSLSTATRAQQIAESSSSDEGDAQALLMFKNGLSEQCAVPLSLVTRVEKIRADQIQHIGGKRTIQYRDSSLPLVTLSDVADTNQIDIENDELVIVVFQVSGREIGLLASLPVNAVEKKTTIDNSTLKQKGIMGSAIIDDCTTLIVDIFELVNSAIPEIVGETNQLVAAALSGSPGERVILLAEDSTFFRSQVKSYLEEDGNFQVLAAEDGQLAWETLQENAEIVSLVVTDIEMPRMDGLGLAQTIRSDTRFSRLPIIALTSLAGEDDIARGKAVGINDYQVKLDKEKLLSSVYAHLSQQNVAA